MFEKGALVVYGNTGVCRVEDIGPLAEGSGGEKGRTYYTLSMVNGSGTIFVPVDTRVFMRPILTAAEVNALIDALPQMEGEMCSERNLRALSEQYNAAFTTHQSEDLLRLIKGVYAKEKACGERGKSLGVIDQRYQKKAEELVHGEFAVALGIESEQVVAYISKRLEGK